MHQYFLVISKFELREQGTGNREQGTGNREQGTGRNLSSPSSQLPKGMLL
jgi:hypothetical protein